MDLYYFFKCPVGDVNKCTLSHVQSVAVLVEHGTAIMAIMGSYPAGPKLRVSK